MELNGDVEQGTVKTDGVEWGCGASGVEWGCGARDSGDWWSLMWMWSKGQWRLVELNGDVEQGTVETGGVEWGCGARDSGDWWS